ncbi:GDSL-type esterase/lipase family protein [Aneurinibacillus danicus]|uniref:Lipase/acylhydrolase n=1 Tax=Aneurinibacillus danicus TaxID=267746 RepID=A0A511V8W9_9BACL|nr:GDSL-type esterase/lipase family protein [Aneurinibacillus danicus]GEN35387.1 lipase/acylhydrolase [Aneurinibacillus danicus]
MSSRTSWRLFAVFSLVSMLVLAIGLYMGVRDILFPSAVGWKTDKSAGEEASIPRENKIQIVALGDSLTRGTGDGSGLGYVGHLRARLAQVAGQEVYVLNHGVNGYKTADLLRDLQKKEDIRRTIRQADIITLSIGGNDLFNAGAEEVRPEESQKRLPGAVDRYRQIVKIITSLNPKAKVLYVGLYNAFADLSNARESYKIVQLWNGEASAVLYQYPNTIFVPTDDLFRTGGVKYLSSDHFHPNQAGYRRIGERMAEVVR